MNLHEAAEKAMQALRLSAQTTIRPDVLGCCEQALSALDSALAEAEEPVALSEYKKLQALVTEQGIRLMDAEADEPVAAPRLSIAEAHELFAKSCEAAFGSPPRCEPLTDEVIAFEWEEHTGHSILGGEPGDGRQMFISPDEVMNFVRAVERAHGIGGDE